MPSHKRARLRAAVRPRSGLSMPKVAVANSRSRPNCWTSRPSHFHGSSPGGRLIACATPAFAGPKPVFDSTRTCTRSSGTGKRLHSRVTSARAEVPRVPHLSCSVPPSVSSSKLSANHEKNIPPPALNRPRATSSFEPARCHSNRKQPPLISSVTDNRSGSAAQGAWPSAAGAANSDGSPGKDTVISAASGPTVSRSRSRPTSPARSVCR